MKTRNDEYIVSAIVSTYNSEKFIRGCLEDLESQTIAERLEIIVVDSCSQENEQALVKEFQHLYKNIIYIRTEERETIYAAWNRGIKASRGKYITNANTDDRHRKDAFERMVDVLESRPDIALVYADAAVTDKENGTFELSPVIAHFLWPDFDPKLLFQVCYIGPQPMWRRNIHSQYGFFDERYKSAGDYEFWLRIAGGKSFFHIPEILGLYLISPEGVENKDQFLSYQESERARNLYWPESWGKRPQPDGSFLVPVHPSVAGKPYSQQRSSSTDIRYKVKLKTEPLVSVIIPTYNRPDMLIEAIESVLRQTYKNYEIIVVNNGDKNISKILEPYKGKCDLKCLNSDNNRGPAAARNRGLQKARGKYIAYLDDDDIYYPNHLETLVGFLEQSNFKVAYSDSYQAIQEWDGEKYNIKEKRIAFSEKFDRQRLLVGNYIPTLNIVHRRDCIEKTGLFDESLDTHEDWDLWIRMSRNNEFYHVQALTAEFRTRSDSSSSTSSKRSDFLRTMKIVHSRYANLAEDEKVIEQQKRLEDELGREIYVKERLIPADPDDMFVPLNNSDHPETITSGVSVIIPVLNGGEGLRQLLDKIRSQKKVDNIEIIIVDSGSTDDSVRVAGEFGARVIPINRSEFNHGRTRNLGASYASGAYLVFTVQDALPVSNYWLYKMICPFIAYPELAALSVKQFVKPEADLFSIWSNENMISLLGFEGDTMYSLSEELGDIDWTLFDNKTKRVLTFFDNVSSCIRKDIFQEFKFSPLINAEDIDFGTRLLENRKPMAYLTSTGVYHWHEKGADDLFKRNYIGTKAQIYTLRNHLSHNFDMYNINWKRMAENISGLYNLISISIAEMGSIDPSPITTVKSFITHLSKGIESSPDDIERDWEKIDGKGDNSLHSLINEVFYDVHLDPEQQYNFRQNFITPLFMKRFEEFAEYLCQNHRSLKGREDEFVDCIYKLFAMEAGAKLGFYYLEAESLNRLTPDINRADNLLARGVCYS